MKKLAARALLGLAVLLGVLAAWVLLPLPDAILEKPAALSLTLEDRHGVPLRTTRASDGTRAGWITLEEMDPQLIQAFIALEDHRFYRHPGVDARAVGRAAVQAIKAGRVVSGASTISMQLARLVRGSGRGIPGKISQSLWALRLEAHLTKQEILEHYLNRVPLGQGTAGVGAAAALYFDASASRLSLGQAALLAGLAGSPAAANPFASESRARRRQRVALTRMVALGFASADAAERGAAEPLARSGDAAPFIAPHFTSRALAWVHDSGWSRAGAVRTSLDVALQAEVEEEVRHTVSLLRESEVREAAAVVIDNASGEILAWVGSPDFWADTAGQVDMVTSPRQPGSALKPFLFGLAFDRGYTAASILPDIPRTYRTATGPYQPNNYDRRFHGPVRAREALASSFNVPAVELTHRLGAGSLLHLLRQAGFALPRGADNYGLGLSLGNGDVSLLDLANAYRGLAAGGVWREVSWTLAARGRPAGQGRRFLSPASAFLLLDILSDAEARVPGFGVDTPFDFPFPVAVKTGTSHHFTDNWAVGVAGNFTVAVWAGNFSGRPMRKVSGVTGAGPLLRRVVLRAAARYAPGVLPGPAEAGLRRVRVCRLSGERAGHDCPGTDEWFLPGEEPKATCSWHQNRRVQLPGEYAVWASNLQSPTSSWGAPTSDAFRILSPAHGDRYEIPAGTEARYATIALRATGSAQDLPVRWTVDGRQIASDRWALEPGRHVIRAVGASGRTAEAAVEVR